MVITILHKALENFDTIESMPSVGNSIINCKVTLKRYWCLNIKLLKY
jgi:hypothetical protein